MLLYCIRHGESTYNAEGRIQGQSDVPLSDLGRQQGEATAAALAALPIEAIFCSPLRRAVQTAQPLADALRLPLREDPRLMEVHVGNFQDRLRSELDRLHPEAMARWRSGDPDFALPGGESRRELMRRGEEVFREIRSTGLAHVAVVTHGGLLAAALKSLLEIPAHRHPFVLQNGSITRLDWNGTEVRLLSLSQFEHLRGIGLSGPGDL